MGNYTLGIDVSVHNGEIDWDKVKASGKVDFVMIRAGYGQYNVDRQFVRNSAECERLGIPYGVYWFSYAKTQEEAEAEAYKCLETLKGRKVDYPVAFDWEDDSLARARKSGYDIKGKTLPTQFAIRFLNIIRKCYLAMIYTNKAFLDQYFDKSLLENFDFWYANWRVPNFDSPITYGGIAPQIWQYSEKGSIPGIKGPVDLNVCYREYKKEEEELTPDQIYEGLMTKLNFEKQSSWAEREVAKAKEVGFTDGSNPYAIPSRAEVMAMINRAGEIVQKGLSEGFSNPDYRILEAIDKLSTSITELPDRIQMSLREILDKDG